MKRTGGSSPTAISTRTGLGTELIPLGGACVTPQRRFTLLDSLVMIAALAGSMALFRLEVAEWRRFWYVGLFLQRAAICRVCLLPPTIAVLILRLRHPRPRFRRL